MKILILAGMLSLATLAHAGPRPTAPPPTPSLLSQEEQLCEGLGQFALEVGLNRNVGISQFATLRETRRTGARLKTEPGTQALYEAIVRMVYREQAVSPVGLQQHVENVCVAQGSTPVTTTRTTDRY